MLNTLCHRLFAGGLKAVAKPADRHDAKHVAIFLHHLKHILVVLLSEGVGVLRNHLSLGQELVAHIIYCRTAFVVKDYLYGRSVCAGKLIPVRNLAAHNLAHFLLGDEVNGVILVDHNSHRVNGNALLPYVAFLLLMNALTFILGEFARNNYQSAFAGFQRVYAGVFVEVAGQDEGFGILILENLDFLFKYAPEAVFAGYEIRTYRIMGRS